MIILVRCIHLCVASGFNKTCGAESSVSSRPTENKNAVHIPFPHKPLSLSLFLYIERREREKGSLSRGLKRYPLYALFLYMYLQSVVVEEDILLFHGFYDLQRAAIIFL